MSVEWPLRAVDEVKAKTDRAISIGPFGSRMKAETYVPHGVPVIRGNNLSGTRTLIGDFVFVSEQDANEMRSCNVFADDLVFPHRGAIGEVGIVPRRGAARYMLSTSLMKVTCDRDLVDPFFVYYFFRSSRGRHALLENASTVGTPGIGQPLRSLRAIVIPIPPLEEQHRIAQVLCALDDKIELNRRMSETLESMARALFKSWLVDFDVVRAKAGAREADSPRPIIDLFPSRLVDSDHGEIPEGWQWTTLAELAHLNPEVWTPRSRPATIKYVDLSNTKWGRIEAVATYDAASAPSRAQRVVRPGDTIVGTVRPGNGSYALISGSGLTASTGFAVLRPKTAELAALVYLAATASENIERLAHLADGGAYPAVRPEAVAATPVLRPSAELLGTFSSTVTPLLTRMAANDRESRTLGEIRDTLLPKLISGEVRVPPGRPADAN